MYLYGAGGHAKVIMDVLRENDIELSGIIDDNPDLREWMGHRVLSSYQQGMSPVLISIGANGIRKRVADWLKHEQAIFGTAVKHCIVNTGAAIDHECVLEDYVHVSPHATLCGNVHVGEGTWIGAGSVINPGVRIGKWTIIGSGSVVCKDIPDGVVAYGSPCRIMKKNTQL